MGFWSRLREAFAHVLRGPTGPGGPTVTWSSSSGSRRGDRELLLGYRALPWMRAIVGRLADECATASRFQLWTAPEGEPDRQPIPRTDRRYEVLEVIRRPTRGITFRQRMKLLALWKRILGDAYLIKQRGVTGRPVGLVPCSPLWIRQRPTADQPRYQVAWPGSSTPVPVSPADVIPFPDIDPWNPWGRGVGLMAALADELNTDENAAKTANAIFENWSMPDGIIHPKGVVDPKLVKIAKADFEERYQGARKRGQIHWSPVELDFKAFVSSLSDQDFIELRKFLRDMALQVNSCPPEIMGVLENANRSTVETAFYHLALAIQVHFLNDFVDGCEAYLLPDFAALGEAHLGYVSPVPEDRDRQIRAIAVSPPAFRVNDLRAAGGFAPDPDYGEERLSTAPIAAGPTNLPPGKALDAQVAELGARLDELAGTPRLPPGRKNGAAGHDVRLAADPPLALPPTKPVGS